MPGLPSHLMQGLGVFTLLTQAHDSASSGVFAKWSVFSSHIMHVV